MSLADDDIDWNLEKLAVAPEIPLTSAPLKAIIYHVSEVCRSYMENFMLCKRANGNPEACLDQNIVMTRCAFQA